jgi:septum formation protein
MNSSRGPAPPLVLASQSPRRAQLLAMLGLQFEVLPADVDETYLPGEVPDAHVKRLACDKVEAVARRRPDALILGSDTVVVLDDEVLGKPVDEAAAVATLLRLQGREHRVETGIAVRDPAGVTKSAVVGVQVTFKPFHEQTAREYVATGEPMDKAGSYGIQGYGATLVERIDGDYFAVMGLPVVGTLKLLRELGWRYDFKGLVPCRHSQ